MLYKVTERRTVPTRGHVTRDETIILTSEHARERCSSQLRQVTVWDAEHQRELVFLTNIFHLAASTIGAIYKDRWQIELFFKALKQNLKIKTFVGTSENAVPWSLSNLAAMLRFNLLSYRDLWAWLDEPFKIPIVIPDGKQPALLA